MGGVHHITSAAPSSSEGELCSTVESLPRKTILHELPQCESFSWAAVFMSCSLCGSPMVSQVLPANLHQNGVLSQGGHRSCQEPAPAWASHMVVTATLSHPPALAWSPPGSACGYLLYLDFSGLQGYRLHGNLCSGAWNRSPSFFFNDLDLKSVSHIITQLSA